MTLNSSEKIEYQHPNFFRRCAAMFYDLFLLAGVLFVCFLPVPVLSESFRESLTGKLVLQSYLLFIIFVFFGWFWTHQGQTLGMRAWRMKVISDEGNELTWGLALKRFAFAILSLAIAGLGLIWSLFHPKNMTFHDLYSGSKVIMLEKTKKQSRNPPQ